MLGEEHYKKNLEGSFVPRRIFNKKTSERKGRIYVELSRGEPIEIRFTRQKLEFVSGKTGAQGVFLRGYGAARLFGRQAVKSTDDGGGLQDAANLFSPEKPLEDPNDWLLKLPGKSFDGAAITMRDLLNLPDEVSISS